MLADSSRGFVRDAGEQALFAGRDIHVRALGDGVQLLRRNSVRIVKCLRPSAHRIRPAGQIRVSVEGKREVGQGGEYYFGDLGIIQAAMTLVRNNWFAVAFRSVRMLTK